MAEGTASYLYCIVRSASKPRTTRVPDGIPGAGPVSLVLVGRNVWIVAASVPLSTYGPEPLERGLADMQWVGEVAVAHEAVVEHFARTRGATVIPMKLFTMFSSERRASEDVKARLDEVRAVLKRINGCEEWGIRVTRASVSPAAGRPGTSASSGAAFLAAKKQARDDARRQIEAAAEAAAEAFAVLRRVARDVRRRDDAPAGAEAPPLLDAAFLVPVRRLPRFKAVARKAAARCNTAGTHMILTGPWPAYNFAQPPGTIP